MKNVFVLALLFSHCIINAQITIQDGAGVYLERNSELTLQGDLSGNDHIEGDGAVLLNGTQPQSISLYNNLLPRLVVENRSDVLLLSDLTIEKELMMKTGRLQTGQYTLNAGSEARLSGNEEAYIETGDNGRVVKFLDRNEIDYLVPVGAKDVYTPLLLRSNGSYFNASVEVASKANPSPNKPLASKIS